MMSPSLFIVTVLWILSTCMVSARLDNTAPAVPFRTAPTFRRCGLTSPRRASHSALAFLDDDNDEKRVQECAVSLVFVVVAIMLSRLYKQQVNTEYV